MNKFLIGLLVAGNLVAMDPEVKFVSIAVQPEPRGHARRPSAHMTSVTSSASSDEHDDLCDFAINRYIPTIPGISKYLKPFLRPMLEEPAPHSPDALELPRTKSNVEVLRRVRELSEGSPTAQAAVSDSMSDHAISKRDQRVYDMIVKAMHGAIEERERLVQQKEYELELREARIKEKYSGKKTAMIAGVTGAVTTICSTLITLYSK